METRWSTSKWLYRALHPLEASNASPQIEVILFLSNYLCISLLSLQLTALQAKVHYLRYISELKLYGGKEFKSILLVRHLSKPLPSEFVCRNLFILFSVLLAAARRETDGGDAVSGPPIWDQSRHQRSDQPCGPLGRLQPRQPH